ncbi:uncharacterized protein NDAI_0C03250 [Naumovozyma dairenensis CBS 421]|uniref:Uncharacterized protein n=1 Tax=Naumovozyma dairenensis (strain ATCC 10597 / BCRC 20456 / CBS 421 / NBRC 0211 / NRRL Y-12639) TaxID=1071378 RepID=G0W874_NAUDC|nr:hypothetical protein NDAI_0C03250 [Naumovozyma dairenensis CBS 421]CCD23985.1 hypothetical protein NDAI_0C03250 [Naumovozyma dairenensis CBS 421]
MEVTSTTDQNKEIVSITDFCIRYSIPRKIQNLWGFNKCIENQTNNGHQSSKDSKVIEHITNDQFEEFKKEIEGKNKEKIDKKRKQEVWDRHQSTEYKKPCLAPNDIQYLQFEKASENIEVFCGNILLSSDNLEEQEQSLLNEMTFQTSLIRTSSFTDVYTYGAINNNSNKFDYNNNNNNNNQGFIPVSFHSSSCSSSHSPSPFQNFGT